MPGTLISNTKDAIVESETTLAENNNEYSNKNSLFYSDISSYEILDRKSVV